MFLSGGNEMLYIQETLLIDLIMLILFIFIVLLIIKGIYNKSEFKNIKLQNIITNKIKVNNSYISIKNNKLRLLHNLKKSA